MEKTLPKESRIKIVYYCKIICKILQIIFYFCKIKMRNMKSLHIFLFIVIKREEKFQGSLWENERLKATLEYEKPRVNVSQRSPWKSIYVTLSFMRGPELLFSYFLLSS